MRLNKTTFLKGNVIHESLHVFRDIPVQGEGHVICIAFYIRYHSYKETLQATQLMFSSLCCYSYNIMKIKNI